MVKSFFNYDKVASLIKNMNLVSREGAFLGNLNTQFYNFIFNMASIKMRASTVLKIGRFASSKQTFNSGDKEHSYG